DPKAPAVAIIHGLGDHSGRWERVGRTLQSRGFTAYALDLPGHGRSEGRRGHVKSWDDYRNAVTRWIETLRQGDGGRRWALFGHSLGALIALDWAELHPRYVDALVLSAPPFELSLKPGTLPRGPERGRRGRDPGRGHRLAEAGALGAPSGRCAREQHLHRLDPAPVEPLPLRALHARTEDAPRSPHGLQVRSALPPSRADSCQERCAERGRLHQARTRDRDPEKIRLELHEERVHRGPSVH